MQNLLLCFEHFQKTYIKKELFAKETQKVSLGSSIVGNPALNLRKKMGAITATLVKLKTETTIAQYIWKYWRSR